MIINVMNIKSSLSLLILCHEECHVMCFEMVFPFNNQLHKFKILSINV